MFHDHLLPAVARSLTPNHNETTANPSSKRKRRPAGTPDPDAEVVALSPKTLLESDRYVCEICNQGFQRDQNLQMHRRRHKVPWKLLKRETAEARKRVFVCPEPTCLHHNPGHALGDLVGIKKHYRRKHSSHRQWVCARCSKAYAVQSDYKAHLKTCGTRGHSCDCGRVFSRVESFIEHQDICLASLQPPPNLPPTPRPVCRPPASGGPDLSSNKWLGLDVISPASNGITNHLHHNMIQPRNFELQLLPASLLASPAYPSLPFPVSKETTNTQLHLSVGSPNASTMTEVENVAAKEKEEADEVRRQAKTQLEMAEEEFIKARRLRQEAHMELSKAQLLRDHALKQINYMLLQITCLSCRQLLRGSYPFPNVASDDYNGRRKDEEGESEV